MAGTVLFGGTFDPIHHGHLITCRAACETLEARRVLFVPAGISPHKLEQGSAAGEHRLAMLKLAIAGVKELEIETMELDRTGPSYTVDTVKSLRAREPEERFILLLGVDQLARFYSWHRVTEILEMVEVALLARPGVELFAGLTEVSKHISAGVARRLEMGLVKVPQIEISATDIRERVKRGESIRYLVPEAVEEHIKVHHLYK